MTGAPPLLVIAGATATGKTGLAIDVAERLAGEGIAAEVISADSRQVFRGLDIGTAKATVAERSRHPPSRARPRRSRRAVQPRRFRGARARRARRDRRSRRARRSSPAAPGCTCGRSLAGIATDALPADADVRARLESEFLAVGLDPLVERLRAVAPDARRARSTLRNPRRVVRALEIAALDGGGAARCRSRAATTARSPGSASASTRPTHLAWIADRARAQFDAGLVEEARALRERFDPGLPAFSAIGYREAWAVLDGRLDRDAAIAEDARRNAAFAKRQRTWFRSEPDIEWLDAADGSAIGRSLAVARTLMARA